MIDVILGKTWHMVQIFGRDGLVSEREGEGESQVDDL